MPRPQWASHAVVDLVAAFCILVFLVGLGRSGLWEELEVSRVERALGLEGPAGEVERATAEERGRVREDALASRLIAAAYSSGHSEENLRLPNAAAAVLTLVVGLFIGAALFGVKPAVYGAVVLSGMPLFLFTGRLLVWSPFPILAHALVVGGAALACFGRFKPATNAAVGLALLAAGVAVGSESAGPLFGVAAPLVAASLGLLAGRPWRAGGILAATVVGLVGLAALAAAALVATGSGFELEWASTDPTFEDQLKKTLLGAFPWTGLIVVGLGALAVPEGAEGEEGAEGTRSREGAAGGVLLAGVAVTFLAQTLWTRQNDGAPLDALWPLALGAGLVLDRVEQDGRPRRIAALVCGLLMLLGLRDQLLDPNVALAGLGAEAELPEGAGGRWWSVLSALVLGVPLVLILAHGQLSSAERSIRSPRSWLARALSWIGGGGWVRWLVVAIPALLLVHGLLAVTVPGALWFPWCSCLERELWLLVGCLVPALALFAVAAQATWALLGRLGSWKAPLAAVAGAAVTLVSAQAVLPALSLQLSSREVIRAYGRLATRGEPLYSYRAEMRSSKLVGGPEMVESSSLEDLVGDLTEEGGAGRRFAVIRAEDLARVDTRFRKRTSRHVAVADDSSSSTLLLASQLPEKLDRNPLLSIVPLKRPQPKRAVLARFDDKIELIGMDVESSGGGETVCPAEAFTLRFYWHCLKAPVGQEKIFVHVDGWGLRINGDHDPAGGRYPTPDWQTGDYVIDELELRVPMHFRPADYQVYVGFFQGSRRMKVTDGPGTSDDRAKAGVVRVR